jgi:hypothetical protein
LHFAICLTNQVTQVFCRILIGYSPPPLAIVGPFTLLPLRRRRRKIEVPEWRGREMDIAESAKWEEKELARVSQFIYYEPITSPRWSIQNRVGSTTGLLRFLPP